MESLKFEPQIFSVSVNGLSGDSYTYELLTVDGSTPNDTIYFLLKTAAPSSHDSDQINAAIEKADWSVCTLEELNLEIADFDINLSVFECTGGVYDEIVENLKVKHLL